MGVSTSSEVVVIEDATDDCCDRNAVTTERIPKIITTVAKPVGLCRWLDSDAIMIGTLA